MTINWNKTLLVKRTKERHCEFYARVNNMEISPRNKQPNGGKKFQQRRFHVELRPSQPFSCWEFGKGAENAASVFFCAPSGDWMLSEVLGCEKRARRIVCGLVQKVKYKNTHGIAFHRVGKRASSEVHSSRRHLIKSNEKPHSFWEWEKCVA